MMSLASKSGEIIIFIAVVLSLTQSSPVPPSLNTAGTPNTQCTINPPQDHGGNITLGQMKSLACLLEATVMEAMKSPSIPSFDMFRPENQPNDHAYVTEVIDTCVSSFIAYMILYIPFISSFLFCYYIYK